MYIHKEGWKIVLSTFFSCIVHKFIDKLCFPCRKSSELDCFSSPFLILIYHLFFQKPSKKYYYHDDDGYLSGRWENCSDWRSILNRIFLKINVYKVSVFMSPANVHVNRAQIAGEVKYSKYHDGKYLVAWHPKSLYGKWAHFDCYRQRKHWCVSPPNSRKSSAVLVYYLEEGDSIEQGADFGFIKFGSRVDMFCR